MPKILLVEDNEMNRDMLSRRLRRKDYEVDLAVDGQEALDQTRAAHPDIILLDMSLPVKDGWTVAQELKADEATSGIPIIALTAHAMVGDREKALAAGCDEYETKPIDFKRLVGKIEGMLNG
jgi:CheY-like chemotaxis protein